MKWVVEIVETCADGALLGNAVDAVDAEECVREGTRGGARSGTGGGYALDDDRDDGGRSMGLLVERARETEDALVCAAFRAFSTSSASLWVFPYVWM